MGDGSRSLRLVLPDLDLIFGTSMLQTSMPRMADSLSGETLKDDRGGPSHQILTSQPYLFVALEADRPLAGGARYVLDGVDEVVIGRGPDREASRSQTDGISRLVLRLPGRSLSSVHARLHRTPEGWRLEDARSTNGTFVDGNRIDRTVL